MDNKNKTRNIFFIAYIFLSIGLNGQTSEDAKKLLDDVSSNLISFENLSFKLCFTDVHFVAVLIFSFLKDFLILFKPLDSVF